MDYVEQVEKLVDEANDLGYCMTAVNLLEYFGSLLPYPITITVDGKIQSVNQEIPPWEEPFFDPQTERQVTLDYGKKCFGIDFIDYIPLDSPSTGVRGVAYVLPHSPSPSSRSTHKVYLKKMLLSEQIDNLLPEWAFFVRCVVNVTNLRPTASRESFYEDATLLATRDLLGKCLQDYLVTLSQFNLDRLKKLISIHYLAIKGLAVHDQDFYRLFINWLPFETSLGEMTLPEYHQHSDVVRYVATRDQFRQIARVAASQSICVINGGYIYDRELLEQLNFCFPDLIVEHSDASELTHSFADLSWEEREKAFDFVKTADIVLQHFQCSAQIKKFFPQELPALYSTGEEGEFQRSIAQSQEIADSHWGGILENITEKVPNSPYAQLCFNWHNSLVQKLISLENQGLQELSIKLLYVQSLLLGHHPLNAEEMKLLNSGLVNLIDISITEK